MFAWLPIVGPIIQGLLNTVSAIFLKKEDTAVAKIQANRDVELKNTEADEAIIATRAQVAIAFKDDLGVQLCRDLVLFPSSTAIGIYAYNWAFSHCAAMQDYIWKMDLDTTTATMIVAPTVAFLLVTAWRGR